MRARTLFVTIFAGALGAVTFGGGCGGSSSDSTTDAGGDALSDVASGDTGGGDSGSTDSATCSDADLKNLQVKDASLGEAGSTGACVSCSEASCGSFIDACNANCDCKDAAVAFYQCISNGGSLLPCAFTSFGGLSGKALNAGEAVGTCVYAACKVECGLPDLDGGNDAHD